MTTIFLNLGPRTTGGELLPETPFRAFVRFDTTYAESGGTATLILEEGQETVGKAVIDWPKAEQNHSDRLGKFWIASGAVDEIDMVRPFPDHKIVGMLIAAIRKAGWPYRLYSHALSGSMVQARFNGWILDELQR